MIMIEEEKICCEVLEKNMLEIKIRKYVVFQLNVEHWLVQVNDKV